MKKISEIDKNFNVNTQIDKEDVLFYNVQESPFEVYGVFAENGKFRRLPENVARTVSSGVYALHTNTSGGRVRFRTNSSYVAIHAKMSNMEKVPHMPLTGSAGFDLYTRVEGAERYIKTFVPPYSIEDGYEGVIELGDASQLREITINFPLYSDVIALYVGLCKDADVAPPIPYKNPKPIVYYGSSITQGGCASRPGMAYESIISRNLDSDYINLGFSGCALGEPEIAEHIKNLNMSVFVYDYDYNAPSVEHLWQTHEQMYKTIRNANPDLPIIMMSRPKLYLTENETERYQAIQTTYMHAKVRGENVYLLDGKDLMERTAGDGTVDGIHPNDLGFSSMAQTLTSILKKILYPQ